MPSISSADLMADIFYTIEREGTGKFTEKKSRFLSFAYHVTSADEAKSRLKALQNEYHDARHVCWAYVIGPEKKNGRPTTTVNHRARPESRSSTRSSVLTLRTWL